MAKAITLNHSLALAIGQDAGNRQMRKAGRKAWNRDDFSAAAIKSATVAYNAGLIPAEAFEQLTGMKVPA